MKCKLLIQEPFDSDSVWARDNYCQCPNKATTQVKVWRWGPKLINVCESCANELKMAIENQMKTSENNEDAIGRIGMGDIYSPIHYDGEGRIISDEKEDEET